MRFRVEPPECIFDELHFYDKVITPADVLVAMKKRLQLRKNK